MREKKFTEGPWCVNSEFDGNWIEQATNTLHAVCMITAQKTMNKKEVADAALISAAPELLEALEQLIEYPQCLELPARTQSEELKNALAAIAKAYGECNEQN